MFDDRIHNFSAGPAALPTSVLETVQKELLNFQGAGMSVMEMSHRSKEYDAVICETQALVRSLLGVPDDYSVLFLQGGASMQFAQVPMNLYQKGNPVDVILTGSWTKKAVKEINKIGESRIVASSEDKNFSYIPKVSASDFNPSASYAKITSNNTIFGTQFHDFPDTGNVPLVADMSSDIMSRPLDVSKFGVIYAGAQKNLGPSGVTLVIVKNDLVERAPESLPTILQYRTQIANDSMFNTPPTFAIYMLGLVLKWVESQGGLATVAANNEFKAKKLYTMIDEHPFFYSPTAEDSRSYMNAVFRIEGDKEDLEKAFVSEAAKQGISGIKGHRSVGGLRASIYNAVSEADIDALIAFMHDFSKKA